MLERFVGEPSKNGAHPTITSERDLRAFHDQYSRRRQLERFRLPSVVVAAIPILLLVFPALVLHYVFGIESELVAFPILVVGPINAALTLLGLGLLDGRLCETMCRIRPAFDADDDAYFGFQGRLFEQLYQESLYTPVFPGPDGRRLRPRWIGAFVLVAVGLFALVVSVAQTPDPSLTAGVVLFYSYVLYQVVFAALTIVTLLSLLWVAWLFMGYRVTAFTIVLENLRKPNLPGLEPYGRLLFIAPLPGFLAATLTGVAGVLTGDVILLVTATIATVVLTLAFVGGQFGLHVAIVRSKETCLTELERQYQAELEQVFHPSTRETPSQAIRDSEAYLSVKQEVDTLPEWPTSLLNTYQFISVVVLSNVPTVVEFVLL